MDWPLLEGLDPEDRARVLSTAQRRRFARREVLFHEGDLADTLHLIGRGRVAVRVTTPLGDVATLAILGQGDCVRELALMEDAGTRTATVIALEPTETLALRRAPFTQLRRAHPSVDQFLVTLFAAQVRRVSQRLVEALYVAADVRVVRRIIEVADYYGGAVAGTVVPLTQEDLGSLAGTARATANRVLRAAEQAGAVQIARGRITIVDPVALERFAR